MTRLEPKSPKRKKMDRNVRPSWAEPLDNTDDNNPLLPRRPLPNSYWVTPELLASEYPGAEDDADAIPRLNALLDVGIREFFDLTHPNELAPYEPILRDLAKERGLGVYGDETLLSNMSQSVEVSHQVLSTVEPASETTTSASNNQAKNPEFIRYRRFTIPDGRTPSPDTAQKLVDALLQVTNSSDRRSVIHCWGGIGRTGTIAACYLIAGGYVSTAQEALEILAKKWKGVYKSWRARQTPETRSQFEYVRSYVYQPSAPTS